MMTKSEILCILLFLACSTKTGLSLKCYECSVCDEHNLPPASQCEPDHACSKVSLHREERGTDINVVIKSCIPRTEINYDCKELLRTAIESHEGQSSNFMADFERLHADVSCNFCETDYCNSSNVISSSISVFGLMIIFYVFYYVCY